MTLMSTFKFEPSYSIQSGKYACTKQIFYTDYDTLLVLCMSHVSAYAKANCSNV